MQNLFHGHRQVFHGHRPASVLAIAVVAMIATMMAALPAVASAANTLSLSVEPNVPREGKPFDIIGTGTHEGPFDTTSLDLGFGPISQPCASNADLEYANPDTGLITVFGIQRGPFIERVNSRNFGGRSHELEGGAVTGRYRACGYLDSGSPPLAADRLEFTVGGTCDSATNNLTNAKQNLRKAKRNLRKAKRSLRQAKSAGTGVKSARKKVRRAKTRVKKGRAKVRKARSKVAALC